MHASYSPLNLTSMLRDVSPFLQAALETANRPYLDLHNMIQQQNSKLDSVLAALTTSTAANEKQVALLQAQVDGAKERAEKAECMNAVYDFISACERLLCKRYDIEPVTISRALSTDAIDWGNLSDEFDISDANEEGLVAAINKVKNERLEYGHASNAVAEKLVLSTSLIAIAQEHFTLTKSQLSILEKMLAWSLSLLPDTAATLLELRQAAE